MIVVSSDYGIQQISNDFEAVLAMVLVMMPVVPMVITVWEAQDWNWGG